MNSYRWCFVPGCTSTTMKTPGKHFFLVPRNMIKRKYWFKAVGRLYVDRPNMSNLFACQDHFNLEEDVENFEVRNMMGLKLMLKRHAIPNRLNGQSDMTETETAAQNRRTKMTSRRERRQLVKDAIREYNIKYGVDQPSAAGREKRKTAVKQDPELINPRMHSFTSLGEEREITIKQKPQLTIPCSTSWSSLGEVQQITIKQEPELMISCSPSDSSLGEVQQITIKQEPELMISCSPSDSSLGEVQQITIKQEPELMIPCSPSDSSLGEVQQITIKQEPELMIPCSPSDSSLGEVQQITIKQEPELMISCSPSGSSLDEAHKITIKQEPMITYAPSCSSYDTDEAVPLMCGYCGRSYASVGKLRRHIRNLHTQVKTSHGFIHLKHYVKADHINEKLFNCEYCTYRCVSSSHLVHHVQAKHTNEKSLKCDHCTYRCFKSYDLKRHVQAKHTHEKPFECEYCSYRCVQSSNLNIHIKAKHSSAKPFKCNHCTYTCFRSSHLKRHIQGQHKNVKSLISATRDAERRPSLLNDSSVLCRQPPSAQPLLLRLPGTLHVPHPSAQFYGSPFAQLPVQYLICSPPLYLLNFPSD